MQNDDDVSVWIARARNGDQEAATQIWATFVSQLMLIAQRAISCGNIGNADEQDVVQSCFKSFFNNLRGNLASIANRDELWRVLVTITRRKVISLRRRHSAQKRASDQARVAVCNELVDLIASGDPTPEFLAILVEEFQMRLDSLAGEDDTLVAIARLKFEGYTNDEIAGKISKTTRSVERKLKRIRSIWSSQAN